MSQSCYMTEMTGIGKGWRNYRYILKGHLSVPIDQRMLLLDLFALNGVDSIFSGHVHFENLSATEYKGIHQYMLTSINWQMTWFSMESGTIWGPSVQSYYKINVRNSEIHDVQPIYINERRAPRTIIRH